MVGVLAAGAAGQTAGSASTGGVVGKEGVYAARVRPLLVERCGSCHGEDRQRGGLALHTPEAIAEGGNDGPVLVAGEPGESELVKRLRAPSGSKMHMPPANTPQLTEEQIQLVEAWIAAGASFGPPASPPARPVAATRPAVATRPAGAGFAKGPPSDVPVPAPDPAALTALLLRLVHVEVTAQGSNRLRVDFAAVAGGIKDADAVRLLEPVLPQLEALSLARCPIGDRTAALLERAAILAHLDLGGTQVTDAGVAALARLPHLSELVLVQARLTDQAVEHLAGMPALQHIYLFKSGVSKAGIARLRERKPDLHVDAGDSPAAVGKAEPDFKLSGDAPPPAGPKAAAQTQPVAADPPAASRLAGGAGRSSP